MTTLANTPQLDPKALHIEGEGGVHVNVWDHGGDGPALFLAHCTGTHGRIWDPLVPVLQKRFHVYAWDSRGHGDSDAPTDLECYTWRRCGEDLVAVYDALGIERAYAAGHSAGASHLCYAEIFDPGRIKAAVLIDPIIHPPLEHDGGNPLAIAAAKRRATFDSKQQAYDNYASKPPMNAWTPETLAAYCEHGLRDTEDGRVALKCRPEVESEQYKLGGSTDIAHRLGELTFQQITLVTSENSNVRQLALYQHQHLPPHEFIDLPKASHFIPQEAPDAILDIAQRALT